MVDRNGMLDHEESISPEQLAWILAEKWECPKSQATKYIKKAMIVIVHGNCSLVLPCISNTTNLL
eukprot:6174528-Ditylum_brightwellii.AAC.2